MARKGRESNFGKLAINRVTRLAYIQIKYESCEIVYEFPLRAIDVVDRIIDRALFGVFVGRDFAGFCF